MINTLDYMKLKFLRGGRERPEVDCWGMYRLVVGENTGKWLDEFSGVESSLSIAKTLSSQRQSNGWRAVERGQERAFDLVLLKGFLGDGRATRMAPLHVGCMLDSRRMIDIEETTGVMVRPLSLPTVVNRVIGTFRPEALL